MAGLSLFLVVLGVSNVLAGRPGVFTHNPDDTPSYQPTWTDWGPYSACSESCGPGFQFRSRTCPGGSGCAGGSSTDSRSCQIQSCVVVGAWGGWTQCTVTCGFGTRQRFCSNGANCGGNGFETQACTHRPTCPTSDWNHWGAYGSCSVTCGNGQRSRARTCNMVGGQDCQGQRFETTFCNPRPCPLPQSIWNNWNPWSACPVTCGGTSTRTRTRTCNIRNNLLCVGQVQEFERCGSDANCPESKWGVWGSWGQCSGACGIGGSRRRSRFCNRIGSLDCFGSRNETQFCFEECPQWSMWSNWGGCNPSCGFGSKTRTRQCNANNCGAGAPTETISCNQGNCPPAAILSLWSTFSQCSASCGGGQRFRSRTCSIAGQCQGPLQETLPCNNHPCVTATWGHWTHYSGCSASCGPGQKTRTRQCEGGTGCFGSNIDTTSCQGTSCKQPAGWNAWASWGACSKSCGAGTQSKTRTCNSNTDPSTYQGTCQGQSHQSRSCQGTRKCAAWLSWSHWTSCTRNCGTGSRSRSRQCNSQSDPGTYTGSCVGDSHQTEDCNKHRCPNWGPWNPWSLCDKDCGEGRSSRIRRCEGGTTCNGGAPEETKICRNKDCAFWLDWSHWSSCNPNCGPGIKSRTRRCNSDTDPGTYAGACVGKSHETGNCNKGPCVVWGPWGGWSLCNKDCGSGTSSRIRTCQGGIVCGGGPSEENRVCKNKDCAFWLDWSNWSSCPVSCGFASRSRSRQCNSQTDPNRYGGTCPGDPSQTEDCNNRACPEWGPWTPWSICDRICGSGSQTRSRTCRNGETCPGISDETAICNSGKICAFWTPWSNWGGCPVTCGGGSRTRARVCNSESDPTTYAGTCGGGPRSETTACGTVNCIAWSPWEPWSECVGNCGQGFRQRVRTCIGGTEGVDCIGDPSEQGGCETHRTCSRFEWSSWGSCSVTCDSGTHARLQICNQDDITWHGECQGPANQETKSCDTGNLCSEWGGWGSWEACSLTCGGGQQQRSRSCINGENCLGRGTDVQVCNDFECPAWERWGEWSDCGVTCGSGSQQRHRSCRGGFCIGDGSESQTCDTRVPCIRWGDWTPWSACGVSCGTASRSQTRVCMTGNNCGSDNIRTESCGLPPCAEYLEWGTWTGCTATCGPGSRSRQRSCNSDTDPGTYVGKCQGEAFQSDFCNERQCAEWREWQPWSSCSETCGPGFITRRRECSIPGDCQGENRQSRNCQIQQCPTWTIWSDWTKGCSVSCGEGSRTRSRTCTSGGNCAGSPSDVQQCNVGLCPTYSSWSEWSECDAACGTGSQQRFRSCSGIGICTGPSSQTRTCNTGVACFRWGDWAGYGGCSVTCGQGTRTRRRTCMTGNNCPGLDTQTDICNSGICPTYAAWEQWGACSVSCGSGTEQRNRICQGAAGSCTGQNFENRACQRAECHRWSEWSNYGGCSVTCGQGTRTRRRTCLTGNNCPGLDTQTDICNAGNCPTYAAWEHWGACSVSCGSGTEQRNRICQGAAGSCTGQNFENRACHRDECYRWGHWSSYGGCSVTCGQGTRTRRRTCLTGNNCPGLDTQTEHCNGGICPTYSAWGMWTRCSASCGTGSRTRNRVCQAAGGCTGQDSQSERCDSHIPCISTWGTYGGWSQCSVTCGNGYISRHRVCPGTNCPGESEQRQTCSLTPCQGYGQWSTWGSCPATCGSSVQHRDRQCSTQGQCQGSPRESRICNTNIQCPVSQWGTWTATSRCSASCGPGTQQRTRQCLGTGCTGPGTDFGNCNLGVCPVIGDWGLWVESGSCSVTCGPGSRQRTRTCSRANCIGDSIGTVSCFLRNCPVDPTWGHWGVWGLCTASCGIGSRFRTRTCQGGTTCFGQGSETGPCNAGLCPQLCRQSVQGSSTRQSISSENYPNPYPANQDCEWTISCPFGQVATVSVNSVQINCLDGDTWQLNTAQNGVPLAFACGDVISAFSVYKSSTNSAFVKFVSGPNPSGLSGFSLEYWCGSQAAQCQFEQLSGSGVFTSPNFGPGLTYPADITCRWQLTVPAGLQVVVTFDPFDVICGDYVKLTSGVASSPELCRGTGATVGPGPVIYASRDNTLTVEFVSIGAHVAGGFRCTFEGRRQVNFQRALTQAGRKIHIGQLREFDPEKDLQPAPVNTGFAEIEMGWDEYTGCGVLHGRKNEPWHVTLLRRGEVRCHGVIINGHWVLTSADCVYNTETETVLESSEITVITGRTQSVVSNARVIAGRQHYVGRVIVHPDYDHTERVNNTALLWLNKKIKYSDNVAPVCLPTIGLKAGLNCSASGYEGEDMTSMKVELTDLKECIKTRPNLADTVKNTQVCSGSADTMLQCASHRGTAVVCHQDGRHRVYALAMWGSDECQNKPPVYADVQSTASWVRSYYRLGPN